MTGVPYELTPDFLEELFTKHNIDYVVHGDDPCLLPDGTDAYAHAKEMGRFKMVSLQMCTVMLPTHGSKHGDWLMQQTFSSHGSASR